MSKPSTPESRAKQAAKRREYFKLHPERNWIAVKKWHDRNLELHKKRVLAGYYRRRIKLLAFFFTPDEVK